MKRALAAALLAAGCQSHVAAPRQCAPRPADFQRWADFPANIGGARWIAPPEKNTIALTRAGLTWNEVPLGGQIDTAPDQILDLYLGQVAQLRPQPITTFDFDRGVDCATVERVRRLMRRHLYCRRSHLCFQGPATLPVVS